MFGILSHPLQLSHLNGKKSSCRQKGIWQCAPIASTSPTDILVYVSSGGSGVAMLGRCSLKRGVLRRPHSLSGTERSGRGEVALVRKTPRIIISARSVSM